jgi:hypothetical protein
VLAVLLVVLAALLWRARDACTDDATTPGGVAPPPRPPMMEGDIIAPDEAVDGDGGSAVPSDPYSALKQNYDAVLQFTTTVGMDAVAVLLVESLEVKSWIEVALRPLQRASWCVTQLAGGFQSWKVQAHTAPQLPLLQSANLAPKCIPIWALPTPLTSLRCLCLMGPLVQVQNVLDGWAASIERLQALVTWQDPTASTVLLASMLGLALALALLGLRPLATLGLLWVFRPPALRDPCPPPPVNLLGRLPNRSDMTL